MTIAAALVAAEPEADLDQAETVADLVGWAQLRSRAGERSQFGRDPAAAGRADVAVLRRRGRPERSHQPAAGLPAGPRDRAGARSTADPAQSGAGGPAGPRGGAAGRLGRPRPGPAPGPADRGAGDQGVPGPGAAGRSRPGSAGGAGEDRLHRAGRPGRRGGPGAGRGDGRRVAGTPRPAPGRR